MIIKVVSCVGAVVCVVLVRKWRERTWGLCKSNKLMERRTVVITGANSGLGKATAIELVKRGARVILACRDTAKAQIALDDIRRITNKGELKILPLDLASLDSIRKFVDLFNATESRLDVLINNAGVFQCPFELTEDSFEMQLGVNHLGHFLLTNLLLEKLKSSAPSRIIVVSSSLYGKGQLQFDNLNSEKKYVKQKAYCDSKLANVLFSVELAKRLEGTGVNVYAVCPGIVYTNLGRHIRFRLLQMAVLLPVAWLFIRTPFQGCQTILHCAVSEEVEHETGFIYRNCEKTKFEKNATDDNLAKQLWNVSEALTCCPSGAVL